jgi:hypothetical protein
LIKILFELLFTSSNVGSLSLSSLITSFSSSGIILPVDVSTAAPVQF